VDGRGSTAGFASTAQGVDRLDIQCTSGQSEMAVHLEDLAVRVRDGGLVAEIVHGPSYPLLVVRMPSPVLVKVMAGEVHYWWYGQEIYPIAPVDDATSVAQHIHRRMRAMGGRS
jgi:hypothetical protein